MSAKNRCEQAYADVQDSKQFPSRSAAVDYFASFRAECSKDSTYLSRLSHLFLLANRLDEAEVAAKEGLLLAPKDIALLFGHGDIRLSKRDPEGAKTIASRLMELHPADYAGPYLMQRALMDSRKFGEALKYGDRAIQLSAGKVTVLYLNNAVAAYHDRQDSLCVQYAEAAIARDAKVLQQAWGIDEAVYALDRSERFAEALALAKRRKEADANWQNDAALVRMLKKMGVVQ